MSIVTQLKDALIKLGAATVSGDTIATVLKTGLGSITGNALTGNTVATVLNSFNNNHVATVVFSTTPTEAAIVVKSGDNVIAPYEDGNYYLEPGAYTYTASAPEHITKTAQALTIIEDDVNTTKTVVVTLDEEPKYTLKNNTTISSEYADNVVTVEIAYPETITGLTGYKTDALITASEALGVGAIVSEITYNDTPIAVSSLDLEGKTSVYLSELINETVPTRNEIEGHAGLVDVWCITIANINDVTLNIKDVISNDSFTTEFEYAETNVDIVTESE